MERRRAQGDSLGHLSKGAGKGLAVGLLEIGTMGGKRMTGWEGTGSQDSTKVLLAEPLTGSWSLLGHSHRAK